MELPDLGRSAPQVAVNAAGDTVMAIAEVSSEGISRIRIHVPEEMHASPLPPDPPTVTTAVKSSATTRVTWTDNASNVDGYVIEEAAHSYYRPYDRALIVVDRAARSAEAPTWRAPLLIRSFNAGGMSAAAPITPAAVRQRAVGPR